MADFERRIAEGAVIVADGATGTEIERRGLHTGLPLWSSHALIERPEAVEEIHRDYVAAGAEILTANTFRTQARTLARAGAGDRARELTHLAVALARRAAGGSDRMIFVAGSMPPLEDCYRPDRVPPDADLEREHREHARHLADAGADLLLIETVNTVREARAALAAAGSTGLPVWVSFVCGPEARLLSGETLDDALAAVARFSPAVVGVNCLPPRHVGACLPLLAAGAAPFGVYANLGEPDDESGFTRSDECDPEDFAAHARIWRRSGARIVGGCCGTGPDHIRALADDRAAVREG